MNARNRTRTSVVSIAGGALVLDNEEFERMRETLPRNRLTPCGTLYGSRVFVLKDAIRAPTRALLKRAS